MWVGVEMALEKTARVFLDYGIELFVCFRERVERGDGEGGVQIRLGKGEDVEEKLRG